MRLTEQLPMGSYRAKTIWLEPNRNEQECVYKLGQLEDVLEKYNFDNASDLDIEIRSNREKVYKYEGIEKELGVDLTILFKALKNGCFAKETFDYMGKEQTQIIFTEFTYFYYADDVGAYLIHIRARNYYVEDYGKTWALTKEELL